MPHQMLFLCQCAFELMNLLQLLVSFRMISCLLYMVVVDFKKCLVYTKYGFVGCVV